MSRVFARLLVLGWCLILSGCWKLQPLEPLFDGADDPPQLATPPNPPPSRPYEASPEDRLLNRLQRPASAEERAEVAQELIARGDEVRDDLEAARDEALLTADVIEGILHHMDAPPPASAEGERQVEAPWVLERYGLAVDRYVAGDLYGALQIVDAILVLEPDTSLKTRLLRLRRRTHSRILRETILVADVLTPRGPLGPDTRLTATIRLRNLSEDTITMRIGEQGTLGIVTLEYEELAADGSRTKVRTEQLVQPNDGELVLGPRETRDLPVQLPSPHTGTPEGLVGRYHLGGRLRAHTLLVGEVPYSLFIPLLPVDLLALHPEDVPASRDPEGAFLEGVRECLTGPRERQPEAARQVFVAALVMARDDRDGTVSAVVATLENSRGVLSTVLCAALARITGEPLNFTREEWLAWWNERSFRPQETPSED